MKKTFLLFFVALVITAFSTRVEVSTDTTKKVVNNFSTEFVLDDYLNLLEDHAKYFKVPYLNDKHKYGLEVAFGMMPYVDPDKKQSSLREFILKNITKDRNSQTTAYNWAKPIMLEAFRTKTDTSKALSMFAMWKSVKYLEQYDYETENNRALKSNYVITKSYRNHLDSLITYEVLPNDHKDFARHDWLNRWDRDAKIYAFWHRRIKERTTKDYGLSKEDALYWAKIGNHDMWINSNQKTRNIFNNLKTNWINKKITSADPCDFNFFDCNKNT